MLRKIVKFAVVGLLSVAIYFVFLFFLEPVFSNYAVLGAVCYTLSMIFNYFAQKLFTFQQTGQHKRALSRYAAMHLLCMGINSLGLTLLVGQAAMNLYFAQLIVTGVVVAISFVLSNTWVFSAGNET